MIHDFQLRNIKKDINISLQNKCITYTNIANQRQLSCTQYVYTCTVPRSRSPCQHVRGVPAGGPEGRIIVTLAGIISIVKANTELREYAARRRRPLNLEYLMRVGV